MNHRRYDSYCGIYCGACEIMNAETSQDKMRIAQIWEGVFEASPEQMDCSGCKTDRLFFNCEQCRMRPCAQSRGVECCIECEDYPCDYYQQGKIMVERLPCLKHMNAIIRNLRYIRDHGVEQWLADQRTIWGCPGCGTPFTWYAEECRYCGRDLKRIKDYETLSDEDTVF